MKYELDPEQRKLADIYLKLKDVGNELAASQINMNDFIKNHDERLMEVYKKIEDAYLSLSNYLEESLGHNETQYLLDRTALERSGTWKQMLHTNIRPEDGEEVLIANDENGCVFYAEYWKERDLFQQIEYLYGGYSVLGSKNWKENDNSVTHYMPLPDPPKKENRLYIKGKKKEKDDE